MLPAVMRNDEMLEKRRSYPVDEVVVEHELGQLGS